MLLIALHKPSCPVGSVVNGLISPMQSATAHEKGQSLQSVRLYLKYSGQLLFYTIIVQAYICPTVIQGI